MLLSEFRKTFGILVSNFQICFDFFRKAESFDVLMNQLRILNYIREFGC